MILSYVALGHLHKNQSTKIENVYYSGSPILLSFSEANNQKSVNIVSFEGKKAKIKKLNIPTFSKTTKDKRGLSI